MCIYWAVMISVLALDGFVISKSYSEGSDSFIEVGSTGVWLVRFLIFSPFVLSLVMPVVLFLGINQDESIIANTKFERRFLIVGSVSFLLIASLIVGFWTMAAIVLTSGV